MASYFQLLFLRAEHLVHFYFPATRTLWVSSQPNTPSPTTPNSFCYSSCISECLLDISQCMSAQSQPVRAATQIRSPNKESWRLEYTSWFWYHQRENQNKDPQASCNATSTLLLYVTVITQVNWVIIWDAVSACLFPAFNLSDIRLSNCFFSVSPELTCCRIDLHQNTRCPYYYPGDMTSTSTFKWFLKGSENNDLLAITKANGRLYQYFT